MWVLSWNLFHGRARPAAGRPLLAEFAATLRRWRWDVALLQECPPQWPPLLAAACDAQWTRRLTSRNEPLAPRLVIARRNPDLIRANGGGCNAILVRGGTIVEQRARRLTWLPERRFAHGARVGATWFVNLHATIGPEIATQRDVARAQAAALAWAAPCAPIVIGGDLNTPTPTWAPCFEPAHTHHVDHIAARGLRAVAPGTLPDAGRLSDHRPLLVELAAAI